MEGSFSTPEYEELVEATETYRQRLVVRLAGEAGLRASEMARLRPSDRGELDGFRGAALRVRENEGERVTYLPPGLDSEFVRYVNSNVGSEDGRVFDVSERRLRMVVSEAGEAAADETGVERLREVRPSDLRDRFARHALVEEDVDPVVVKEAGGWSSLTSLERHVEEPGMDEIAAAFEGAPPRDDPSLVAAVEAAVEATDRDETVRRVTDALASVYGFSWTERVSVDGTPEVEAVSGASEEVVKEARAQLPDTVDHPTVVESFRDGISALAAPVEYAGKRYGVIGVGGEEGFDAEAYDRLELVGRQVGHSLTAERRRKALSADSVVEVELRTSDETDFLVRLSDLFGSEFELRSVVSASESLDVLHVVLHGTDRTRILEAAADLDGVEDFRLVEQSGSDALVEFSVSGSSVVRLLHGYGAEVTDAVFEDGTGEIVADCAHGLDLQTLVDGTKEAFPETRLMGKREVDRDGRPTETFVENVTDRLTERQQEALRAAYFGGYFDWPRGSTAEEIADTMEVSSPTLHNHLRKGQREILSALFE